MKQPSMKVTSTVRVKPSASDLSACRKLIRHGSKSFFLASLVLPSRIAVPATALYAFCRVADDLIDTAESTPTAIADLTGRLDAIYSGQPGTQPEDRAMAEVVSHYSIPRSMPDALIEGLAWDVNGQRYETLSDLYGYAARVAGCVGAMMSLIMGTSDERALARACDLGVAMQLTNIARDIGEDARMGRLYLPRQWFRELDMDPDAWLAKPVNDSRISAMCRRLLEHADTLYKRAETGITLLPPGCRPGIRAARLIYADIGREIEHNGYQTVESRAIVPMKRRLFLLISAMASLPSRDTASFRDQISWPPLMEIRFLLKDVEFVDHVGRAEWLINLLLTLKERQQLQHRTL